MTITNKKQASTVEEVLETFGFGKFQLKLTILIAFLATFDGLELTIVSVLAPTLRCEWNLTHLQSAFISSGAYIGLGVSSLFIGSLGDIIGRKKVILSGLFLSIYFNLLSATTNNYIWYFCARFFVGVGLTQDVIAIVYLSEYAPSLHRGKVLAVFAAFFTIGNFLGTFLASISIHQYSWRVFLALTTCYAPFLFIVLQWLPESVRMLQDAGKHEEVMSILNYISSENKKPLPKTITFKSPNIQRGNVTELFYRKYIFTSTKMLLIWILSMITYYSIVLVDTEFLTLNTRCISTQQLKSRNQTTEQCHDLTQKNYYQNLIVISGEFPGYFILMLIVDRVNRKPIYIILNITSCVGLFLMNFCLPVYVQTLFMFFTRMSAGNLVSMAFLITPELFPTHIRATATGFCNGIGRLSLVVTPFLAQYLLHESMVALTCVYFAFTMSSVILIFSLKETKGVILK